MGADRGVETPRQLLEDAWTEARKGSRHRGSVEGESLWEGAIDHLRGGRFEEYQRRQLLLAHMQLHWDHVDEAQIRRTHGVSRPQQMGASNLGRQWRPMSPHRCRHQSSAAGCGTTQGDDSTKSPWQH